MIFSAANPNVAGMIELDKASLVLDELNVHVHNFDFMHFLHEVADLVTLLEAESLRVVQLQRQIVFAELLEVILVLTLILFVKIFAELLLPRFGTLFLVSCLDLLPRQLLFGVRPLSSLELAIVQRLVRLLWNKLVKLDRSELQLESLAQAYSALRIYLEAAQIIPKRITSTNFIYLDPGVQHSSVCLAKDATLALVALLAADVVVVPHEADLFVELVSKRGAGIIFVVPLLVRFLLSHLSIGHLVSRAS